VNESSDLATLDASACAELVRDEEASPAELVDAAITRIEKLDGELNAVIHPLFDQARDAARGGLPEGPFRGVPVLVKDLDGSVADAPLHMGNALLKSIGYTADHDSFLVAKLREAGFVIVGKTNTPEFGLLPTTEPKAYGPTHNPWDTTRGPGGSSGGSAAAVASGMVPVAHAGDGGGSIRIPASACGLFGLKPSRGRISLGPDLSEAWAGFVQRHVVSRSVRDSAAILDVLEGPMTGDFYVAPPPARAYFEELDVDPGRLRIGLRTDTPGGIAEVDPACAAAAEDAGRLLESLGHVVEPAAPEAFDHTEIVEHFTTVVAANSTRDVDDLEARSGKEIGPDDIEAVTATIAELGRAITASQYIAALQSIQRLTRDFVAWWERDGYDLLLTPTMAEPPPKLGDVGGDDDPLVGFARATPFAAFTMVFNATGQPAASLPLSVSAGGLPIGVQLVAAPWREDVLVRVAAQVERAQPWADRRPPVHA